MRTQQHLAINNLLFNPQEHMQRPTLAAAFLFFPISLLFSHPLNQPPDCGDMYKSGIPEMYKAASSSQSKKMQMQSNFSFFL